MQIITPLTNKISSKVKNWKEIKNEAIELKQFIDAKNFNGYWEDAYAISHVQVSNEPKNFFVVHKNMVKTFGHWCIINLKIRKMDDSCTFQEGCMSFMFRKMKKVKRYRQIKVIYWTPFMNLFLIPRFKTFKDIPAFICQHENDHSNGRNIYGL